MKGKSLNKIITLLKKLAIIERSTNSPKTYEEFLGYMARNMELF